MDKDINNASDDLDFKNISDGLRKISHQFTLAIHEPNQPIFDNLKNIYSQKEKMKLTKDEFR